MFVRYDTRQRLAELLLGASEGAAAPAPASGKSGGKGAGAGAGARAPLSDGAPSLAAESESKGKGKGKGDGKIVAEWPRVAASKSGWSTEAQTVASAKNSLEHALERGLLDPASLLQDDDDHGTGTATGLGVRDAKKTAANILVAAAITYCEAGSDQAAMVGAIGSAFVPPTSAPMVDVVSQAGFARLQNFLQFERDGGGGLLKKPNARYPPFNGGSGCCEYEVDTEPYHGRDGERGSEGSFHAAFQAHATAIFGSGMLFSAPACMRNINCSNGKPRQATHFDAHAKKGFEEAKMMSAVSALPTRVNVFAVPAAAAAAAAAPTAPVLGRLKTAKYQLTADPELCNLLRDVSVRKGVAMKDLLSRTAAAALMVVGDGGTAERTAADATGITTWFCWLAGRSAPSGDIPTTLVVQRGVGDKDGLGLPCQLGSGRATQYHIMPSSTLFFADGHGGGVQPPPPKDGVPPARARAHTYGRSIGDVCRWFGRTQDGDLMHEAQGSGDTIDDDLSDRYAADIPVIAVKFARGAFAPGRDRDRQNRLEIINARPVVAHKSGDGYRITRKSGESLVLNTEEVLALAAVVENNMALKRQLERKTAPAKKPKKKKARAS
jgi:hypothetical protein